ncbi:hypothetical protein NHQ30_000026 [Ciborinia camelliae]|nr:hypothetical protein NHQ30_000026 [Ciborinia camelliae]
MRFADGILVALTAAGANAAPHPQNIDFESLSPVVQYAHSVPDGITSENVTYNFVAAASSAAAPVPYSSADQGYTPGRKRSAKQLIVRDGDCSVQPASIYTGTNPPDDPDSFLAYKPFADAANRALTPPGYTKYFSNLKASNEALKYMGFTNLPTYDTALCASKCTAINGCNAINIYFERDPTLNPGANCPNPSSMTNVKCVFWGGAVDARTAVYSGQVRSDFKVVIAGSNGYAITTVPTPNGYLDPTFLNDSAIDAPLDSNGMNTFLGYRFFTDTPFDVRLCTTACDATSANNLANPPADSPAQTCQFINTYILYSDGAPQGQACSLYAESWDATYATNTGQTNGIDTWTIGSSYTFSNATNPNYATDIKPATSSSAALRHPEAHQPL